MNKIFASIAAVGALMSASSALAQSSASTSASSSATIIRPIAITNTAGLLFGKIVRPSTGSGTVAITNAADTVTAGSGAVAIASTTSRAKFTVTGEPSTAWTPTIDASFNLTDGTTTLGVTTTSDTTGAQTFSAGGTATINVGGSFNLPSTATSGAYAGTLNVSVAYN